MSGTPSRPGAGLSLLSGVFATGWSAVISIIAVRWYVGLLGIESYGLIGFYLTLQAAIMVFELGLGATVNREVARSVALDEIGGARRLLRSLEFAYWLFAACIAVGVALFAPTIAGGWLGASTLPRDTVEGAVRLMGVLAALRWPVGLYQGALIGLQRADRTYRVTATVATAAHVGAVLLLLYWVRSVWVYFVWQACAALLGVFWMRTSAWRELGREDARFDRPLLRRVLVASAAMSGVAISGLILSQLDKVTVSASVPLADFGRYALAGVLAGGLSVLFVPTFNVIYPRLSALWAAGGEAEQVRFYRLGTRLFVGCLFPIALSAAVYAQDVLTVWTGDARLAHATAPIAALLIGGSALNGVMHFPYALQLAAGRTRLPLFINTALVAAMLPLTVLLVARLGVVGGGVAWLTLNALYCIVGTVATHRFILPGLLGRWVGRDVLPALAIAIVVVLLGRELAVSVSETPTARLVLAAHMSIAATSLLVLASPDTRALVVPRWRALYARACGARPNTLAP